MSGTDLLDPYAGNVLCEGLNPTVGTKEAIKELSKRPVFPMGIETAPTHIRLHYLMRIRQLHIASQADLSLWTTIDLMVRDVYGGRDPRLNTTWADLSGEVPLLRDPESSPLAAAVLGPSGTGKSQGILRCFRGCLGKQVIPHASFPGLHGKVLQLVWLSVEVPASGKAGDLALALAEASKIATGTRRFDEWFTKERMKEPLKALNEWHQWAVGRFLGCLHLDEVQNFFRLQSIQQRKSRRGTNDEPELSVQEDRAIRWFLSIMNRGQYAVLVSGTNDGINALSHRFSTLTRLSSFHIFEPFSGPDDPVFQEKFLPPLIACQLTRQKLELTTELADLLFRLTAGVPRIIVNFWFAAHRVAFERSGEDLSFGDFEHAAKTLLAPLAPAVLALRKGDPDRLRRYEDLVRAVDPSTWLA